MAQTAFIVGLALDIFALVTILVTHYRKNKKQMDKLADGVKCQLRSDMLRIYYRNRESKKIRQYEYENFVFLYEAYKALDGNSFIDKIYDEVKEWEIIP
jgi:hypothetical protein